MPLETRPWRLYWAVEFQGSETQFGTQRLNEILEGHPLPRSSLQRMEIGSIKAHRSISSSQGSILFNRINFHVHQIDVDKEESRWQGVREIIRRTWTGDGKNEQLCHQSKCASIFYVNTRKITWVVLRMTILIHEVHPLDEAVPMDRGIGSLGTFLDTTKGEALIVN